MSITKIKHKIEKIKEKIIQFISLTKLALNLVKLIDNKLIKIDLAENLIRQTGSGISIIILGSLLNSIQEGNIEKSYLLLALAFTISLLVSFLSDYLSYKYDYYYAFRDIEIFKLITEKIKRIPVKIRNTPEFIEIETNADIQKVFVFFRNYISLVSGFYGFIITLLALTFVEPFLIMFLIILGIVSVYLQGSASNKEFSLRNEKNYYSQLGQFYKSNYKMKDLTNLSDNLKINNNSSFLNKLFFKDYFEKYKSWYLDLFHKTERKNLWSKNLLTLGSSLSLVYVYNNGISGALQIGSLVIFAQAYDKLMDSLSQLTRSITILFSNYLNVKAVSDLVNYELPKTEFKKINNLNKLEIEFKNVSFTYPGTKNQVLKNVSFKINHGDHLGIIGENGAGKSTLINLLFRIYAPTYGTITINGNDINDISDDDFYTLFSIMSQKDNPEVGLSFENLIYLGDTSKPLNVKRIIESAKKAQIHEHITKLPDKYKQLVTPSIFVSLWNKYSEKKYTSLSGGQFRKVSLARIFYSNKPVYVLDEPTDSIDPESAFKIFKHINEIPHAQMIIFVTHDVQRLQIVANKILVLKDGEVIEFGETDKLIKNKKSELNKSLATYQKTLRE
jgi:ATP-binding cassette subfamily B protein/ATP-binding cassette subfamily C protein